MPSWPRSFFGGDSFREKDTHTQHKKTEKLAPSQLGMVLMSLLLYHQPEVVAYYVSFQEWQCLKSRSNNVRQRLTHMPRICICRIRQRLRAQSMQREGLDHDTKTMAYQHSSLKLFGKNLAFCFWKDFFCSIPERKFPLPPSLLPFLP